jgi:hypothetical protein
MKTIRDLSEEKFLRFGIEQEACRKDAEHALMFSNLVGLLFGTLLGHGVLM